MIFVGGQVALDSSGNVLRPGDLNAQIDIVMSYLKRVLAALGAELDDVVKLDAFYVNRGDVEESQVVRRVRTFFAGDPPPAAMFVPLLNLAYPGMLVEIEVIAMRAPDG